jgi:hypothetical protein
MTVVRGLQVSTIAGSLVLASCTFLVQFHDQGGDGDAGGASEDGSAPIDTGSAGMPESGSDTGSAPPKDATSTVDHYDPCQGLINGYYCANDGPKSFAGPMTDLIICEAGVIATAQMCPGACLKLPDPFPDACDPCPGVADGLYCGRDLAGFPSYNADFLIQCQSGSAVQQVACTHGCDSLGKMSQCYP